MICIVAVKSGTCYKILAPKDTLTAKLSYYIHKQTLNAEKLVMASWAHGYSSLVNHLQQASIMW